MERLKLDEEGARTGELFEHTLQLGDETVALKNIATMAIETRRFQPWNTPANRQRLAVWAVFTSVFMVIAVLVLGWWGLNRGPLLGSAGLFGLACLLIFLALAIITLRLSTRIRRWQAYARLRIGASDGREINLVDDSRTMLESVRDAIRRKIDHEDNRTVGSFDLNTDTISLHEASVSD